MKNILFDTSAALALYVYKHPNHKKCSNYFLDNKENASFFISTHSIAEMFRHLTSGKLYFTYSPHQARQLIHQIIPDYFQAVPLDEHDYLQVVDEMGSEALHGPIIYDALIARACQKAKCKELVTYNIRDFHKVWQLTSANLVEP